MQQENTIPQPPRSEYETPPPNNRRSGNGESAITSILSTLGIIIAAPLIALVLISFVFQSYEVDGPSMENTLQNGDRLIVLKIDKTIANIRNQDYIPDRGEIIIFHKDDASDIQVADRQLVKRVIGLPGDRVVVREGKIIIYNKDNPQGFDPDESGGYSELIPSTTPGNVDLTVPEGEVFVSGDNRINSLDSRSFGTVAAEKIVGRLALRIYPFSDMTAF